MKIKQAINFASTTLFITSLTILIGCDNKAVQVQQQNKLRFPTANVTVFETSPLDFSVKFSLPGRIIASQIAEIRPQVNGIILKKQFEESTYVKKGQSLYQIDDSIYQANYDKALANFESAESTAKLARVTLSRYKDLYAKKSVSQQEYDKAVLDEQQATSAELSAKASLISAKVNLDYTKVQSPIDGYIGKSNVTEGALVSTGIATPMAIVKKVDPVYVDMKQAASVFSKLNKDSNNLFKLDAKVDLILDDGSKYEKSGKIVFTDRNVSESSGTVLIRASFENPQNELLPGMFVKPVVTMGTIRNAILVPQKGITSDAFGNYTAIVAVPVPNDKEVEYITKSILTANRIAYDKKDKSSYDKAAAGVKEQVEGIINQNKIKNNKFYYFEKRNNLQVYGGIPGYWVVTSGINSSEKVVVTGLLNLSSVGASTSDNKIFANIVSNPGMLTQSELDKLVERNIQ